MFFWHFCLLISQVECGKGRGSRRKQKEEKIENVKILASLPEDDKYLFRKRLKKDTFKKVFAPYVGVYINFLRTIRLFILVIFNIIIKNKI